MVIEMVLERYEGENAVLVSREMGIEISIPGNMLNGDYTEGETYLLTLNTVNEGFNE